MYDGMMVGVVIPARNEAEHLTGVLSTIPDFVDKVVVVDDGSTDGTGKLAVNVELVTLTGEGVGAAIDAGHRRMLELFDQEFVSVVIAGDGQMDPSDMEKLISPIIEGKAHHSKGERLDRAGKMPFYRRIGTFLLAILTTLACGQNISDPQCGYTATSSKVLKTWDWDRSWKGYGYPNWWLMRLAENGWRIKHVPVRAIYSGQRSGIKVSTFLPKVSLMLLIGLHSRIIRNTIKKPSIVLVITWATYLTGWLYHPVAFLIAHITDRMHVRNILRDTR
ncbi:MAG: glycosyltransferase family 2 protein [Euryarchaeota archaeon]|jgi:glycosyltransferase involved in cell wall biosynthesis|nr:glycosyltransferase family 2 protein [Euryarchaeota archaeon]